MLGLFTTLGGLLDDFLCGGAICVMWRSRATLGLCDTSSSDALGYVLPEATCSAYIKSFRKKTFCPSIVFFSTEFCAIWRSRATLGLCDVFFFTESRISSQMQHFPVVCDVFDPGAALLWR